MIRSRPDEAGLGRILKRAHECLALYFEADGDERIRAAVRQSFVRVLSSVPLWASLRAFDDWEESGIHRPSPAHIKELALMRVKLVTDEQRERNMRKADEADAGRVPLSAKRAAEILAEVGFNPRGFDGGGNVKG